MADYLDLHQKFKNHLIFKNIYDWGTELKVYLITTWFLPYNRVLGGRATVIGDETPSKKEAILGHNILAKSRLLLLLYFRKYSSTWTVLFDVFKSLCFPCREFTLYLVCW